MCEYLLYILGNEPHMFYTCDTCAVLVYYNVITHLKYMCGAPVIHMFNTCNTGIYLHMYYMYRTTCIKQEHILSTYA